MFFISFLGLGAIPTNNHYTHEYFSPGINSDLIKSWGNWDGKAYQDIANLGYTKGTTVFFPLYPLLIKAFTVLGFNSFWAGLLISHICTVLALFYLFKLIEHEFNEKIAKRSVFALLIYPTSFYLVALYSESLFLLTSIASFYYARKKNFLFSAMLAGLAGVSRIAGLAVIIALFAEYFFSEVGSANFKELFKSRVLRLFLYILGFYLIIDVLSLVVKDSLILGSFGIVQDILGYLVGGFGILVLLKIIHKTWPLIFVRKKLFSKNLIFIFISFVPLIFYLVYLKINFGSYSAFLDSVSIWGKFITLPWNAPLQVISYLLGNFFVVGEYSSRTHLRFIIFMIALVGFIYSLKKLKLTYNIYFLSSLIIPLISGSLIDFPRYSLAIFPLFIVAGLIENEYLQKTLVLMSILSLSFLTILFVNNYFFM